MRKQILMIDDNRLEIEMLKSFLITEFDIFEAMSGIEGLKILEKNYKNITIILLDIIMPQMDGYEVMKQIRSNDLYKHIPIIITTCLDDTYTQAKACEYGANGFVVKPFSKFLLLNTVHNAIKLSEASVVANSLYIDQLTGLYNREAFFRRATIEVNSKPNGYYIISILDVDNFKIINEQYGTEQGDEVLKHIAFILQTYVDKRGGMACRFMADKFAILYPLHCKDTDELLEVHQQIKQADCIDQEIRIRVGRYYINDLSISLSSMYDRATLAEEHVKENIEVYIVDYDESMLNKLLHEQTIVDDMKLALIRKEFIPWFQPQYNHATGALIGAEALVRWYKNGKFISPAEFIPVFERNGFIYEMDKYIWEEVCKILRKWLDEGHKPLPVSVNISRIDFYHHHFIETITNIIDKYHIPYDMIRLEVTESAFGETSGLIIDKVNQLIDKGFTIEIDDFGSGYSSLNTLKDVNAQILKLDMRFFEKTKHTDRSGNIIEAVVRMAKWLGMAIIAEGVEDQEYADYLKSIGCYYIQGYFYAKPMPEDEFKLLLKTDNQEKRLTRLETLKNLDNNDFWNPKSMDTLIFNSYVGGACIFEYHKGKMEILRVNEQFERELAVFKPEVMILKEITDIYYFDLNNKEIFLNNVINTINTNQESTCEIKVVDQKDITKNEYIRATVRVIAMNGERYLLYCTAVNVTEQRIAEQKERIMASRLKAIMDYSKSGITAVVANETQVTNYVFVNDRFYELLGYTKEQFKNEVKNAFDRILPEDYENTLNKLKDLKEVGQSTTIEMRARKRDGSLVWLRNDIIIIKFDDIDEPVQLSNFIDITEEALAKENEKAMHLQLKTIITNIEGGVTAAIVRNNKLYFLLANDKFYEQQGYTKEQYEQEITDNFSPIIPEDRERVRKEFRTNYVNQGTYSIEYRIKKRNGEIRWIQANLSSIKLITIKDPIHLCVYNDITKLRSTEKHLRESNIRLQTILDNILSGISVIELRPDKPKIIYVSSKYYEMFGFENNTEYGLENKLFDRIFPDDLDAVNEFVNTKKDLNDKKSITFRIFNDKNKIIWINVLVVISKVETYEYPIQLSIFTDVTNEKISEYDLRLSEEEYRLATYLSGNTIGRYNIKNRTVTIPKDIAKRYNLEEVIEGVPYDRVQMGKISKDTEKAYINFFESIMRGQKEGKAIFQKHLNDDWKWISAHFYTVFNSDNEPVSAIIEYHDITKENEKDAIYKKWENSLLNRPIDSFTLFCCDLEKDSSFDYMRGNLLKYNIAYSNVTSFDMRTIEYANQYVYIEDRKTYIDSLKIKRLRDDFKHKKYKSVFEYRELLDNNQIRWLRRTVELVGRTDEQGILVYIMYENINEEKQNELHIIEQAETDPLTGLLNRKIFKENTEHLLSHNKPGQIDALFLLDLDYFKLVNDTLGHATGDQTLIDVGIAIKSVIRKKDLVCRFGGDEFIVYINNVKDKSLIEKKAKQICSAIHKQLDLSISLSTSLGIAIYPDDGLTFDELYRNADKALYTAKKKGKDNYCFYHSIQNK